MVHHSGKHICGLYYKVNHVERVYLPQVKLDSHMTVSPVCSTTKLTQIFRNSFDEVLPQACYAFPLYEGVAVSSYTITYGQHTLKGVVQEKGEARKTYQTAVDRGESAGLLESLPAGVFGVTLGNLPPQTNVTVEITYCGELKHDTGINGLEVQPAHTNMSQGINIVVDVDMAGSTIRKVQSPSHPIAVTMGSLSTSQSNDSDFTSCQASATLALGSTELGEDFVLQLVIDDINKPQALIEAHPTIHGQRAIMATLVPNFTLQPIFPEIVFIADQSGSMSSGRKNGALKASLRIFLKSLPIGVRFNICAFGSRFKMLWPKSQAYNDETLNTAIAFVNGFRAGYGGTEILGPITATFEQRWRDVPLEVVLLTDGEVWGEDAIFNYVNQQIHHGNVDARVFTLGIGTDVSSTLVEGIARAGNGFAQFVTGEEETEQKVIRMLKGALYCHTKDYRVEVNYRGNFSESMGTDSIDEDFEIVERASDLRIDNETRQQSAKHLIQGRKAQSFFDEAADVDGPIPQKDPKTTHPNYKIPEVLQAPTTIPPLFPFNRTSLYILLEPTLMQKDVASVTIRATSVQGPLELTIPISNSRFPNSTTIHQLSARKAIQDLEEGRGWVQASGVKNVDSGERYTASEMDTITMLECVRLGERFQVAGKWTSFVATSEYSHANAGHVSSDETGSAGGHTSFASFDGYVKPSPSYSHWTSHVRDPFAPSTSPFAALPSPAPSLFATSHGVPCFGNTSSTTSVASVFGRATTSISSQAAPNLGMGLFGSSKPAFGAGMGKPGSTSPFASISNNTQHFSGQPFGRAYSSSSDTISKQTGPSPALTSRSSMESQKIPHVPSAQAAFSSRASAPRAPAERKRKTGRFLRVADSDEESAPEDEIDNSPTGKMRALINLQTFCGAWKWGAELFVVLEVDETSLKTSQLQGSLDVQATALAIAFLETKLSSHQPAWEMVVDKAKGWLNGQIGADVGTVGDLIKEAATCL